MICFMTASSSINLSNSNGIHYDHVEISISSTNTILQKEETTEHITYYKYII